MAAAWWRSTARLFLPQFRCAKYALLPARIGGCVRMKSPSGGSILITSAPRSASSRVQYGPDTIVVKSSTRTPLRMSSFTGGLGALLLFHQRQIVPIQALEMLLHLIYGAIGITCFKVLHESPARRNHPRISLLPDRPDEVLHHVDQRVHHDHHHRILGRARKDAVELEMNRSLIVKVDLVANCPLRQGDVRVERLNVLGRRALARGAHRARFDHHPRLGQMLGLNRAEVEHVAQPGDYRVARAL